MRDGERRSETNRESERASERERESGGGRWMVLYAAYNKNTKRRG